MSILAGGDPFSALKLMRLIYTTAKQAKVHRENCLEFANYISIMNNLLLPLETSPQLMELPAVQDTLALLHKSLMKAYLMIQKCEQTSSLSAILKHVPRHLKELEGELQRILSLLNLANLHVNLHLTDNERSNSGGSFGESQSLHGTPAKYDDIPTRSFSLPSFPGDNLDASQGLQAQRLTITWGGDERFWKWVNRAGSRFSEVAYLSEVYWLEVQGVLNTSSLKAGTYNVSWRLQVACLDDDDKPSGWDSEPVVFKLSSKGSKDKERAYYLGGSSGKASSMDDGSSVHQNGNGQEGADDWMDYYGGTFTVDKRAGPSDLTFSMSEVNGGWKRGLFLDGIFFTRILEHQSSKGHKKISFDEEQSFRGSQSSLDSEQSTKGSRKFEANQSTQGIEESLEGTLDASKSTMEVEVLDKSLSSLTKGLQDMSAFPDVVSFSGHPHELKLMTDPYFYECEVCETEAQGVGYRCHQCMYDVHPQCCISDHHFATLLDLTDAELSHWNWATLLDLNKHRADAKATRPKTVGFAGHPHPLKLTQFPHPLFICDAGNCDGHGWVYKGWDRWVYHCAECNFDIHPECRFEG